MLARVIMGVISPFARSSAKGAETGIYLCTSPEVEDQSGRYYFNNKLYKPASHARIAGVAEKLWETSESLIGGARGGSA